MPFASRPGLFAPVLCIYALYYWFAASEVEGAAFTLVELGQRVRQLDDDVSPRACDLTLLRIGEISASFLFSLQTCLWSCLVKCFVKLLRRLRPLLPPCLRIGLSRARGLGLHWRTSLVAPSGTHSQHRPLLEGFQSHARRSQLSRHGTWSLKAPNVALFHSLPDSRMRCRCLRTNGACSLMTVMVSQPLSK